MKHAPFLKLTSRELVGGRMVDVKSVSVCRCGRRFDTDEELGAHVLRPIALQLMPTEETKSPQEVPAPTMEPPPMATSPPIPDPKPN